MEEILCNGGDSLCKRATFRMNIQKTPFSLKMLRHLEENVLILGPYEPVDTWLFSKNGFDEAVQKLASERLHLIPYSGIVQETP